MADEQVEATLDALSSGANERGSSGLATSNELFDCVKLGTGAHGESIL